MIWSCRIRDSRLAASEIVRGSILTSDGKVVAQTTKNPDGSFTRTYPDPATAYLAGYYSPLLYGSSNLEQAYDAELMGTKGGNPITQWLDGVLHREKRGYDLKLSINDQLQKQANQLLGDQRGAIVLMDAKTGAIVAMASTPNFDPNKLYVNSGPTSVQQTAEAKAYWAQLNSAGNSPLLLRPTQGLYVPGSIFKTVTASAAIQSGIADPDTVYRDEGALTVESRVIPEENRPDNNRINYTLTEAYGWSLNVVFAQVGLQVGADRLTTYAQRFGFGTEIPFDLPVNASQIESDSNFLASQAAVAVTAFGQGQLQATPLQMAMVADAVANGGNMMTPYLVNQTLDPERQCTVDATAIGLAARHQCRHRGQNARHHDQVSPERLCLSSADSGLRRRRQDRNRGSWRRPSSRTPGSSVSPGRPIPNTLLRLWLRMAERAVKSRCPSASSCCSRRWRSLRRSSNRPVYDCRER